MVEKISYMNEVAQIKGRQGNSGVQNFTSNPITPPHPQQNEISSEASQCLKAYATPQIKKTSKKCQHFSINEVPQREFTKEGITYNTSPKNYVAYLNANNKSYEVKEETKLDPTTNKRIKIKTITEKSDKGAKYTMWVYENMNDTNHSEIVRDEEYYNEATILKRIVFHQNETELYPINRK